MHRLIDRMGGAVIAGALGLATVAACGTEVGAPPVASPGGEATANHFALERAATGLDRPTFVGAAPGDPDALWVLEQAGRVLRLAGGQRTVALDLSERTAVGSERGLLGVAFHPSFERNGRFFVFYTRTDGDIVVARFTANQDRTAASASTGAALLRIEHSAESNHNGGGMAFEPDGYLYIAVGDGGGSGDPEGDARSITRNYLGKILRIDVNGTGAGAFDRYSIPPGNPYRGRTGLDEIWARGLRNPWRISFDRSTGALWIADVGQGRREEIDRQSRTATPGRDYGWNIMEGSTCYRPSACPLAGDTLPVAEYGHTDGNCSITGGFVHRGTQEPGLVGRYLFADYCSGRIWSIPSTGSGHTPTLGIDTNLRITSFGEAESGNIYVVASDGGLYRIAD